MPILAGKTTSGLTIQLIPPPMRYTIGLGVTEGELESNPFDSIKLGKLLPRDQRISQFQAAPLYVATQMGHADTTMVMRTYGKWITAGLDRGRRERLLRLYAQTNLLRADEFPKYN